MTFIELLRTQPALKALHMTKMNRTGDRSKTRLSIMNEIELSSHRDSESEVGSLVLKSEPPKMFILPTANELDEALAQSIVHQVIAMLPRVELRKLGGEGMSRPSV